MSEIEIRVFEEADESAVIALWKNVFAYPQPRNNPESIIRQKLACQRDLFFVGLRDGHVAGTVMGGYDGHRGWVYSLAVDPALRRQGIGAALMKHVERALAERGAIKINLQVLTSNVATAQFYEKVGYLVEERISMGKVL